MWAIKGLEIALDISFVSYGIRPRTFEGLDGILFSPFLHGDINHLLANTTPVFFLTWTLFYFYPRLGWRIVIYGGLLLGFWVWIGARPSYHLGASGIVYLLAAFLFFIGLFIKNRQQIAISLLVVFLYGSIIWGILPKEGKTSWEGHLSGFVAGLTLAFYYRNHLSMAKYKTAILDENEEPEFGYCSCTDDEYELIYKYIETEDEESN